MAQMQSSKKLQELQTFLLNHQIRLKKKPGSCCRNDTKQIHPWHANLVLNLKAVCKTCILYGMHTLRCYGNRSTLYKTYYHQENPDCTAHIHQTSVALWQSKKVLIVKLFWKSPVTHFLLNTHVSNQDLFDWSQLTMNGKKKMESSKQQEDVFMTEEKQSLHCLGRKTIWNLDLCQHMKAFLYLAVVTKAMIAISCKAQGKNVLKLLI